MVKSVARLYIEKVVAVVFRRGNIIPDENGRRKWKKNQIAFQTRFNYGLVPKRNTRPTIFFLVPFISPISRPTILKLTRERLSFDFVGPRLNGQILAEFSRVQETAPESSLRVKSATLWIYVQLNGSLIVPPPPHPTRADRHVHQQQQQQRTSRSPTLYVFRLLSSPEPLANANASGTSDKVQFPYPDPSCCTFQTPVDSFHFI